MLFRSDFEAPAALSGLAGRALVIGAAGAAASIAGFFLARQEFIAAYLVGWLLWYTVAVGSLRFLMLQHLSGGGWGLAARRILEAAGRTIPFVGIAAIPLFLGLEDIFLWADPAKVALDEALQHKATRHSSSPARSSPSRCSPSTPTTSRRSRSGRTKVAIRS